MRILAVWLLLAGISLTGQTPTPSLSTEELEKYLKDTKKIFLLDVREPKEIAELGSVKGYVNIPLGQLESRLSELPKDKLIITACNRGVRAGKAEGILKQNGFKTIGSCGLNDWKAKGKPLVYPKKD